MRACARRASPAATSASSSAPPRSITATCASSTWPSRRRLRGDRQHALDHLEPHLATSSTCRARASRSTRPARPRSSPSTRPCRRSGRAASTPRSSAGVNVLASPFNFICFSTAQMLSRTGLCQAFSKNADGYVRAEGGVVFVLQSAEAARRDGATRPRPDRRPRGVNSDGRTNGISLPSRYAQGALLEQVYREAGIEPRPPRLRRGARHRHPVGDPIEASAIGEARPRPPGAAADRLDQDQYRPPRAGLGPRRHAEGDAGARARPPAARRCTRPSRIPTSRSTSSTCTSCARPCRSPAARASASPA